MDPSIPESSGIYRITCTSTGKFYIGSAINLRARCLNHRRTLRRNTHRSPKLQRAWDKYGEEAFTFEVIELVLIPEFLIAREQYWFDVLQPFGENGFNTARIAGSSLGREMSQFTKDKIAATKRGKPGKSLGMKRSPETCEKISIAKRGKTNPNLSHRQTPEVRAKMSEIAKKRPPASAEVRRRMQAANTYIGSEECLANLRKYTDTLKKTIIAISPDGTEYIVHGISQFCKEHHLNHSRLVGTLNGKCKHHKGWTARYPNTGTG